MTLAYRKILKPIEVYKKEKSRMKNKPLTKTKTYEVPVSVTKRWKLTPEDVTIIKLAISNFSSKHKELESRRKSLLNRMRGDFFMVLYAPDCSSSSATSSQKTEEQKPVRILEEAKNEKDPEKPFVLS
jgi:CRISPR/Cas system-associated endonuclease Cas3-HD